MSKEKRIQIVAAVLDFFSWLGEQVSALGPLLKRFFQLLRGPEAQRIFRYVRVGLKYLVGSFTIAVLYYLLFSLIINTDTERQLKKENAMFEKFWPDMENKDSLLSHTIAGLSVRNAKIYELIFDADAPSLNKLSDSSFLAASHSLSLENADKLITLKLNRLITAKVNRLKSSADKVEENFRAVYDMIDSSKLEMPPMSLPIEHFSFARMGASVGVKFSPFYKVATQHNGLDIMSPTGSVVKATADGTVSNVVHSRKGQGNVVIISHPGGYQTLYAHLGDVKVSKGKKVRCGDVLGMVGMTGNTFAPHLHYEVLKDGVNLNPLNFFFADLMPDDYANMMYISTSTGKSMD